MAEKKAAPTKAAKKTAEKKAAPTKADQFFPLANLENKPLQRVQTNLVLTEAKDKKSCTLSLSQSYTSKDTVIKTAVFPTCAKLGRELLTKFASDVTKVESGVAVIGLPAKKVLS